MGMAGISLNTLEVEVELKLETYAFYSTLHEISLNAYGMFNTCPELLPLRTSEQKALEPIKAKATVAILLQLSVSG